MKKLKAFILTAMITLMFGTSVINAYETYIPVSISYEKIDSNGDGVEDSITILYDKTYVTAESVIIPGYRNFTVCIFRKSDNKHKTSW